MVLNSYISYEIRFRDLEKEIVNNAIKYFNENYQDAPLKKYYGEAAQDAVDNSDYDEMHFDNIEALYVVLNFYINSNHIEDDGSENEYKTLFNMYYDILAYYNE